MEKKLESYIGQDVNDLPAILDGVYPIVDNDTDEVLSFMDLEGDILFQGNLPAKKKYYSQKDFLFLASLECYFL